MSLSRIGRYEIQNEIGRGAMAVVYRANDSLIGRTVAIKTIRLEHGSGMDASELRTRLYREARSAGVLNHPNIVTIYDIGEEGDNAFIAMEFVEGESLESWLGAHPIPALERTISIVEQIASGLDYAAAKGIIHRDIKPGNILMSPELRPKIADFGIAKIALSKLTMTGTVMGTPSYMSPEQAMGKDLDGRSDIFSLGVIFYQMLTGERPFVGTNPTTIIYKILHENPIPPRNLNITLHPGFDYIVGRMLAKDPAERYQSCADVIADLKNYAALGPAQSTAAKPVEPPLPARKRTGLAVVASLFVVAAAASLLLYRSSLRDRFLPAGSDHPPVVEQQPPMPPPAKEDVPANKPAEPDFAKQLQPPAIETAPAGNPKPKPDPVPSDRVASAYLSIEQPVPYALTVLEGNRRLGAGTGDNEPIEVPAGEHRFRLVAEDVFLDRALDRVKLKPDEEFAISAPGLGSAYIEVPDDAYDGCTILLDGRKLAGPYPAQLPKLAAGEHRVQFRWAAGAYKGNAATSAITIQENHHYLVKGDPAGQVTVRQVR